METNNLKMTQEQKDHFSSERNHWCIVKYSNYTPIYYAGYFGKYNGHEEVLPAFTTDFNQALKLHSKIAAEALLNDLKKHTLEPFKNANVEDHAWM